MSRTRPGGRPDCNDGQHGFLGFEPRAFRIGPAVSAVRALAAALGFAFAAISVFGASPAAAGCVQNGTTVTCTGDVSGPHNFNFSTSSNINLDISNVTTGPSQASAQGVGVTQSGHWRAGHLSIYMPNRRHWHEPFGRLLHHQQ